MWLMLRLSRSLGCRCGLSPRGMTMRNIEIHVGTYMMQVRHATSHDHMHNRVGIDKVRVVSVNLKSLFIIRFKVDYMSKEINKPKSLFDHPNQAPDIKFKIALTEHRQGRVSMKDQDRCDENQQGKKHTLLEQKWAPQKNFSFFNHPGLGI